MKVALVIKSLSLPGGGAERILVDLAAYLAGAGHETVTISFDTPKAKSFYPIDPEVTWHKLGMGQVGRQARPRETLRRIFGLRRAVRSFRPDVAVGFMHSSYVPLALGLVGSGIPVIGSEHIVVQHYAKRQLQYFMLILSSFFIARFTVLSENIRRHYSWFFRRKAVVMPNPVSLPRASKPKAPHNRKVILTVGKLEPQKDQITLLKAFASLAEDCHEWDLRVIGEGSQRSVLEAEVARLGLDNRVALHGATRAIGDEYLAADIFVLPSLYESFGLVTVEAMVMGLPVIGFSDCPGTNELILDGVNGILVESGDRVENLAMAMRCLIESADLRESLGQRAKLVIKQFAPERIFGLWVELLRSISRSDRNGKRPSSV